MRYSVQGWRLGISATLYLQVALAVALVAALAGGRNRPEPAGGDGCACSVWGLATLFRSEPPADL